MFDREKYVANVYYWIIASDVPWLSGMLCDIVIIFVMVYCKAAVSLVH